MTRSIIYTSIPLYILYCIHFTALNDMWWDEMSNARFKVKNKKEERYFLKWFTTLRQNAMTMTTLRLIGKLYSLYLRMKNVCPHTWFCKKKRQQIIYNDIFIKPILSYCALSRNNKNCFRDNWGAFPNGCWIELTKLLMRSSNCRKICLHYFISFHTTYCSNLKGSPNLNKYILTQILD